MSKTPFIITIDTEGDDQWTTSRGSREITTRNAAYLPRFQSLCERFRFKPVYLANYEMVMSDVFVEFAGNHVARELDKNVGHHHLIVRKVNRLETEPLAERLETREVCRVAGGNFPRSPRCCPLIVALGVNRDDEGCLRHGVHCATRSGRPECPQAPAAADCRDRRNRSSWPSDTNGVALNAARGDAHAS